MRWCATVPRNTAITAITGKGLPLHGRRLPAVFCRCRVFRRRQAGREPTGWTSLALADIDHIGADRLPELIGRVRADKHTLLSYTTISGTGLRIIYRTDCLTDTPEKNRKYYSKIFEQGNRYYAGLLGCECDLKCKNITRLSGLAHDPDVYFHPDAVAMPVELKGDKKEQPAKPSIRNRRLEKAVAAAAGELAGQGIVYEAHQRNQYIMRMGYLLNAYGVAPKPALPSGR